MQPSSVSLCACYGPPGPQGAHTSHSVAVAERVQTMRKNTGLAVAEDEVRRMERLLGQRLMFALQRNDDTGRHPETVD